MSPRNGLFLTLEIKQHPQETPKWFALRVTYGRELQAHDAFGLLSIPSFVPMRYEYVVRNHKKERKLVPAVSNLVFVRTQKAVLDHLKHTSLPYLRYIMKHDSDFSTPLTVRNDDMENFIRVARQVEEDIRYINPDDYDTYTMISNASVNVRSTPGTNGAILGTFGTGDEVNVIEIEDNGWAAIVYGDMLAYVFADYLDEPSESEPQQPDEELQIPDEGTDSGEEELQIPDDSNTDGIIDEDYTESIVTLPPDEGSSPDGNSTDGGAYNITTDEGAAS